MILYYLWFSIFAIIIYFVVIDQNLISAVILLFKLVGFEYEKRKWMLLNNPQNPIVKYLMWRRALRLAKEFEKEFKDGV